MTHRRGNSPPSTDSTDKLRPEAPGMQIRFACMGCGQRRNPAGSRGQGVRRRCAQCLEQAQARKAAP